jgi:membrane peptidoglycan carboxypeptidase
MYPNRLVTWLARHRQSLVLWTAASVSFAFICGFSYSVTCGFHGCPSVAEIRTYASHQGARRITVPLDRIPSNVRNAFIAVEDRRFAGHHGIDWYAFGRALVRNVRSFGVREGASTLTMQVARSAFLCGDDGEGRSLGRKLIELRLAPRIESALSKDKILELYLNLIYLGDGTYGVEAASRHYFGKGVDQLTLAEAATLAALPRAPSTYHPGDHPDRSIERRNLVLALMAREGFITTAAARTATSQRLRVARQARRREVAPSSPSAPTHVLAGAHQGSAHGGCSAPAANLVTRVPARRANSR